MKGLARSKSFFFFFIKKRCNLFTSPIRRDGLLEAVNLQPTEGERTSSSERRRGLCVITAARDPLKNLTALLRSGGVQQQEQEQPRRMRSQQQQQVRAARFSDDGTGGRSAENAWWSLEWRSPREKEPPAVGIGGGKLPSCTSTLIPAALYPLFSLLRPRPRTRWGPNVHRHPSALRRISPPFNRRRRRQGWLVLRSCPGHETDLAPRMGFACKRRVYLRFISNSVKSHTYVSLFLHDFDEKLLIVKLCYLVFGDGKIEKNMLTIR